MLTSSISDAGTTWSPDADYGYLDLEVDSECAIYRFGLVLPNGEWDADKEQADQIREQLVKLYQQNKGLCGHNIRRFDYPHLIQEWAELEQLLVIDTLELSILAFPLQPSHKLQKDYKLSQYASNNPLEDARATRLLLQEILKNLNQQPEKLQLTYRFLLACGNSSADRAYQQFFARLQQPIVLPDLNDLPETANAGMSRVYLEQLWQRLGQVSFDDRLIIAALLSWNHARTANQSKQSPSAWLSHLPSFYSLLEALFPVVEDGFTYQPYFHEFNVPDFRLQQEEAVQSIIDGKNPLILMATGGGKSLCYQLPALMLFRRQQRLTICISPLQALMEDQVADLEENGLDFATFINGTLPVEERSQRIEQMRDGCSGLLYISPEQLRSISIRNLLQERLPVLWVIDEAHCISQWGHDFRPDYRYIPKFIQGLYAERQLPIPRLALLTATATAGVRDDIKQLFSAQRFVVHQEIIGEVKRDNLAFVMQQASDKDDKDRQLLRALEGFKKENFIEQQSGCVLIYTTTRKEAERLAAMLNRQNEGNDFEARHYHSKISKEDKSEILKAFKEGSLNIVTATCAFGMGINRKDVRVVIHHTMSSSLEAYIQEAGRAGRDRKTATCMLLFNEQDAETIFFLKSLNQLTLIELRNILKAVRKSRDRIQRQGDRDAWFWVTPDEIFQSSDLDETFASEEDQRNTKIKVALDCLEQFQLIERAENLSSVVQFNLVHPNPQESCRQFEQYSRNHNFSELQTEQFRRLIYAMHLVKTHSQKQDERFPLVLQL